MITTEPTLAGAADSSEAVEDERRRDRIGAIGGIAFVALSLLAFAPGRPPAFDAPIADLSRYAHDKATLLLVSAWLSVLSLPGLLLLVTRLRERVAARGGAFATVATFFNVMYATALGIAGVAFIVSALPAFEVARLGTTSDVTVRLSSDLTTMLFSLHLVIVTVIIATISLSVVLAGVLPRWVGVTGGVVALGTLTASLGTLSTGLLKVLLLVAYMPGLVWWLAVSIALLRHPGPRARSMAE